ALPSNCSYRQNGSSSAPLRYSGRLSRLIVLNGSSAPLRKVMRKPALAFGSLAASRPSTVVGLPK
nr:hypothetical protein [Tanacetum cinerariifolium]